MTNQNQPTSRDLLGSLHLTAQYLAQQAVGHEDEAEFYWNMYTILSDMQTKETNRSSRKRGYDDRISQKPVTSPFRAEHHSAGGHGQTGVCPVCQGPLPSCSCQQSGSGISEQRHKAVCPVCKGPLPCSHHGQGSSLNQGPSICPSCGKPRPCGCQG